MGLWNRLHERLARVLCTRGTRQREEEWMATLNRLQDLADVPPKPPVEGESCEKSAEQTKGWMT